MYLYKHIITYYYTFFIERIYKYYKFIKYLILKITVYDASVNNTQFTSIKVFIISKYQNAAIKKSRSIIILFIKYIVKYIIMIKVKICSIKSFS